MADDLSFLVSDSTTATTYDLQLSNGNDVKSIWSRQVPLVNGRRPYDWCSLLEWKRNEDGMLALVNYNDFYGKILQFGTNDDLIAEIGVDMKWVRPDRFGTVQLEPPDRIELTSPDGNINRFLIREGQLADENGRILERPKPLTLQIGKPASEAAVQRPDTLHPAASRGVHTTAPADMPEVKSPSAAQAYEKVPSPSPWPSAVTVVVVAMSAAGLALLWLLLKNRRNAG